MRHMAHATMIDDDELDALVRNAHNSACTRTNARPDRTQTGPFRGPGTALRMKDERCTTHGGSHGARSVPSAEFRPECGEREHSSSGKPEPRDPRRTAPHASRWRCRSPAGYSELYTKPSVHPVKPYILNP